MVPILDASGQPMAAHPKAAPQVRHESQGAQLVGGYRRVVPKRDTRELLAAYNASPLLQSVVRKIAYGVASAEFYTVALTNAGEQPVPDHPMTSALMHGNQMMSGLQATILEEAHLLTVGESFAVLDRNIAGAAHRRWPVPPDWCSAVAQPDWPHFAFTPRKGGQAVTLDVEDVLWLKEVDPLNPYERGSGMARALDDELGADEAAAQHMRATLQNRAIPETIVSGGKDTPLQQDDVERMEAVFMDRFGGPRRAGKPLFSAGPLNVETLTPSFRELDLTTLREFERDVLIYAFGIPPEMIGKVDNSNRASIEAAEFFFTKHVILPRLNVREAAINAQLAPQYGDNIQARFVSPVDEDREFKLSAMKARPDAFTLDEHRGLAGYDALPDGDGDVHPKDMRTIYGGFAATADPAERRAKAAPVRKADEDDIERAVQSLSDDAFAIVFRASFTDTIAEFAEDALAELGMTVSFDLEDPRVRDFIRKNAADRSRLITGTSRERLRATLAEGVSAGESTQKLVGRIKEAIGTDSVSRARLISRTEIVRASNFGTTEAHRQAGIQRRQWLATFDNNVRDTHMALDGQTVGIDEPFKISGAEGMYPGDFGVASLDVNCRCAVSPVFPQDLGIEARAAMWKAYDKRREPHERLLEQDTRVVLEREARAVERALMEGIANG